MTFPSTHDPTHLFFVTAATCGWKRLFSFPSLLPGPSSAQVPNPYAQIVLDSLSWMQAHERILLFAFVLMPSHLHLILKPCTDTIGGILQDFGSHTAHAIMKVLKAGRETELLSFFHEQTRDKRHQHSVWQDIQAKNVFSEEFLLQKLEYLHNNPVTENWQLARDRADYPFSSARYYDRGQPPLIKVTDICEWLCIDPPPGTAA